MYLLIQKNQEIATIVNSHLHSTMYLLILLPTIRKHGAYMNLHSTMYLLILYTADGKELATYKFTFHNVSINSQ